MLFAYKKIAHIWPIITFCLPLTFRYNKREHLKAEPFGKITRYKAKLQRNKEKDDEDFKKFYMQTDFTFPLLLFLFKESREESFYLYKQGRKKHFQKKRNEDVFIVKPLSFQCFLFPFFLFNLKTDFFYLFRLFFFFFHIFVSFILISLA